MKPKQFCASTVFLRNCLPSAMAVASACGDEAAPATFSSSGITFAGLKKCMPTTASGRRVDLAISSMSSVDVFVARRAPGLQCVSRAPKISFLIAMRSKAASTTTSASVTPSSVYAVVVRNRPMYSATFFSLSFPFCADASQFTRTIASPLASASSLRSIIVTSMPACAKHIAMPPPMVPAPTTAALRTGKGATPCSARILPIMRSAEKTCCIAGACGPLASSMNAAASCSMPCSKLPALMAASTHPTMASGATSPLAAFFTCLRAPAKNAATSVPSGIVTGRLGSTRRSSTATSPSALAKA